MASYIDFTLTFVDNSSGDRDESGTQVQIHTDSPSYKPTEKIDYAAARHAWMALPLINAGVTTVPIHLKSPVTFVKVRVRQFNANGYGDWNLPGGPSGQTFVFNASTGVLTPNAPSNVGIVVAGTPTPPVDPPVDPPPDPGPGTGGGVQSNYIFESQFSGVQGQNQWSYKDAAGTDMVYASANTLWNGSQAYMGIWPGGAHPGSTIGAMLRFTVPSTGVMDIGGTTQLYSLTGNTGVTVTVKQNASTIDTKNLTTTAISTFAINALAVTAGDTIDFILTTNSVISNNSTALKPSIQLTTDGTTPANPTLSSITPSSVAISPNGSTAVTVSLSSSPSSAVVVTVTSDTPSVATVPATITIPAGQTSQILTITGLAVGSATITAAYSGSSQICTVAVSAVLSATWPNAPVGGVVLLDHSFATVAPLLSSYNSLTGNTSTFITDDPTAPISPSKVARHRLEARALNGGDETYYRVPNGVRYREMYVGMIWRTNPQFQGRIVANKLWFIKSENYTNTFFGIYGGPNAGGGFYIAAGPNTGGINNSHLFNGDPIGNCYPNTGASAAVSMGVWYKLESTIRFSTTPTSRDGYLKVWLNTTLIINYQQFNMCGPNGEGGNFWMWNETWDGSQDMGVSNTVAWEHYMDHVYIVGKN